MKVPLSDVGSSDKSGYVGSKQFAKDVVAHRSVTWARATPVHNRYSEARSVVVLHLIGSKGISWTGARHKIISAGPDCLAQLRLRTAAW